MDRDPTVVLRPAKHRFNIALAAVAGALTVLVALAARDVALPARGSIGSATPSPTAVPTEVPTAAPRTAVPRTIAPKQDDHGGKGHG